MSILLTGCRLYALGQVFCYVRSSGKLIIFGLVILALIALMMYISNTRANKTSEQESDIIIKAMQEIHIDYLR